VLIGSAGLSLPSLPSHASANLVQSGDRVEEAILKIIRNQDSAIALGKAAHMTCPEMRDRARLLVQILDDLELDPSAVIQTKTHELGKRLSRRIQMDFSEGRTVNLDGWLLSLAEVRLYALAAFSDRKKITS
jgi:hypothetical protein